MKSRLRILGSALLLVCSAAAESGLSASDGDSLVGGGAQFRLLCIDAPELYQRDGAAAKAMLQSLIKDGVSLARRGKDKHDRDLVLVTDPSGASVNMQMLRSGYAWVARYYAATCGLPRDALFAAEQRARRERRGLWRQENAEPPWEWRRRNPRR